MPESSPSWPPVLLKYGLDGFQPVHFPSDVGHDNQERSFLIPRDKNNSNKKQMT